ncbi:hypothetical protein [Prosthecobacter sp.]|uniref:hypothetical protein n=1 Tax=Prosthecobacter sp. TaxID=1965333 RepID=UPI00261F5EE4|nr:hypothetical protein [Prosthecobacter sp.]
MVFVLKACDYVPRCALEADSATEVRVEKILRIIGDCGLSIHDISRTQLDRKSKLPRFNMPFELGLFLGAAKLGGAQHKKKGALILDIEPYRYQKYLSDIAGQDIRAHGNDADAVIGHVRNWLNTHRPESQVLPGKAALTKQYRRFQKQLPVMLKELQLKETEISFVDWSKLIGMWLIEVAKV